MIQCPDTIHGQRYDLEDGHPGPHHFEIDIPADVATLFADALANVEQQAAALTRATRRCNIGYGAALVSLVISLSVTISNIIATIA